MVFLLKQAVNVLALLFPLFFLAAVSGCTEKLPWIEKEPVFKEVPRFESYSELVNAFKKTQLGREYGIADGASAPVAGQKSGGAPLAPDYSRTNVQVEGVDEADIVKTDGKYIYNFSKSRLVITEAYPIETAKIVSITELTDVYPQEMLVQGDRLLLFGTKQSAYFKASPSGSIDPFYGGITTVVQLYSIADKSSLLVLKKELEFNGTYLTSRMIKKHAYFVINSFPDYAVLYRDLYPLSAGEVGYGNNDVIPKMVEDGIQKRIAEPEEIGYFPPIRPWNFVTIVSISMDSGKTQKETIAGSGQNVFASEKNIYIAAPYWSSWDDNLKAAIIDPVPSKESTVVYKFGLSRGKIGFVGKGSVPGHVLNQFSMDEFEGNFRIATTLGQVSRSGSESTNNLYVLDEEMNIVGRLEDLAPGERIYSARFMGKKAYMVTFKKVDPLFVIDVSNPKNPMVLGKLKIPGYSDYLHPIDETHIIGVGKETIEAKQGDFAWFQGMKMAIFDVSNVSNPIEMHKIVIGDRGTDSYALQDHKAFLYNGQRKLLVLPIILAEIPEGQKSKPLKDNQFPAYGVPVFQGAFVYRVTLEKGFEERGRITHVSPSEELKRGYYFGDESSVKRALYIGNVLYTLSGRMLKANSLDTLRELKEFEFYKQPSIVMGKSN